MNYDCLREYLMNKPEAIESFPFGPDVAVFKVRNKMFATLGYREGVEAANLKCDPDEAESLRDIFESVVPGYHMNKRHWNTVYLDKTIPKGEIERMADNSYLLVVNNMPQKDKEALLAQMG